MSGTTEREPVEPGEEGELAAGKGEPPTANPYPVNSAEAEEWLDGHDFATSTNENELLLFGQGHTVGEKMPSQGVMAPAAGEK